MAGKTLTLNHFKKSALDTEQLTSLKGGNVNYLRQRTAREMTRISWEGLDIRINVPINDPDEISTVDLSTRFMSVR